MSNAELIRQAKLDLKISLGQDDWRVFVYAEGRDIKMGRKPVLLTYHQDKGLWGAHVVGAEAVLSAAFAPSAPEAYIKLRNKIEFVTSVVEKI